MRKGFKAILSVLLVLCLFGLSGCQGGKVVTKSANTVSGELSGKTVILHSNDVHGNVEGYAYMAQAKKDFEEKGATVILVDAGDFT